MKDKKIKVRFAPSPTGQLHLGGARTALFNWLFAKSTGGIFLLRIEDTDIVRSKQEYTDQICNSLKWLGLDWDEEIIYQSNRTGLYKEAITRLLETDKAYPCFCSKEKITEERKQAELSGSGYYYSGTCRNLCQEIVNNRLENGDSYSVRMKVPKGYTEFDDQIYGKIKINNKEIDDFIIARTDGNPVYNLVVAIDDNDMEITHIIRGEDHISNTPKQLMVYEALNLPVPQFAHLPMILGPDKKRLSKRHGATGVQEYRDSGYLYEVLNNYLALLGWNPGTEQEIFSIKELINEFSISRVQKKSAVFDERKLQWVSGQHIYKKTPSELLHGLRAINPEWRKNEKKKYIINVILLMQERVKSLIDIQNNTNYFFEDPAEYDEKAVRKKWKNESVNELIRKFNNSLQNIDDWTIVNIETTLRLIAEKEDVSAGKIIHPTRLAISGTSSGPSLFELMELLGKTVCIRRINTTLTKLPLKEINS